MRGLFLGFFSIFAWTFGARADVVDWRYGDQLARVEAELMEKRATGTAVNGRAVWAFEIQFEVDGQVYRSTSYARDTSEPRPLVAEYVIERPSVARIQAPGHGFAPLGPWALITVIFRSWP